LLIDTLEWRLLQGIDIQNRPFSEPCNG
jgi:hypothetical protein